MSDKERIEELEQKLNDIKNMSAQLMADNLTGKGVSPLRLAMIFNIAREK